ncbi:hypothetical protein GALL_478980 [mine drainage metagenome]|uniref:Uncharacterized protein n=1 Tax=mine drainage metagenome TaxID=410659 RepID=A0A1J5PYZ1_9ZZZZ
MSRTTCPAPASRTPLMTTWSFSRAPLCGTSVSAVNSVGSGGSRSGLTTTPRSRCVAGSRLPRDSTGSGVTAGLVLSIRTTDTWYVEDGR